MSIVLLVYMLYVLISDDFCRSPFTIETTKSGLRAAHLLLSFFVPIAIRNRVEQVRDGPA